MREINVKIVFKKKDQREMKNESEVFLCNEEREKYQTTILTVLFQQFLSNCITIEMLPMNIHDQFYSTIKYNYSD